ncbi:MAG: hypothetical protein FWD53_04305, partial [Phycisphaerales bacterium]|nr:hypothetical protein [Phycisphaerales bacterium]
MRIGLRTIVMAAAMGVMFAGGRATCGQNGFGSDGMVISGTNIRWEHGWVSVDQGHWGNVVQGLCDQGLCDDWDYTEILFSYHNNSLQVMDIALDEGSYWYLVNAGDTFSADTIKAGLFPEIGWYE